MKRKRFTEEQIIGILKEAEAGAKSTDLVLERQSGQKMFSSGRPAVDAVTARGALEFSGRLIVVRRTMPSPRARPRRYATAWRQEVDDLKQHTNGGGAPLVRGPTRYQVRFIVNWRGSWCFPLLAAAGRKGRCQVAELL
jgi:hypothetical protein